METGPVGDASIISGPGDWTGDAEPPDTTPTASIVVTAEAGAEIAISRDGIPVLRRVSHGCVTYPNAPNGTYTVEAVKGTKAANVTVSASEPVTYYAGLVLQDGASGVIGIGKIGIAMIGRSWI